MGGFVRGTNLVILLDKKKKKILFVTGSRGEWGYIRPILRLIESSTAFEYSLCVTNMHLLPAYGMPVKEIENDGFTVDFRVPMAIEGGDHVAMVKSLGLFLCSMSDIISSARPDWIMLAGDRGEQLMGALAGAFVYIPVGHIQAGELSGNIDGMTRHAIGKYTHMHFASNQDAANRLLKLGEEPFRVHNVGAPQLDELVEIKPPSIQELSEKLCLDLSRPFLLVVQHATTEEVQLAQQQIEITMRALGRLKFQNVIILPNNDAGSYLIRKGIERSRKGEFNCFANLPRMDYLGLLKEAEAIIGNSSSGLLEAPTYATPAVNIGRRQNGRLRGSNVIDVPFEVEPIIQAIGKAVSNEFNKSLIDKCVNPYGDGHSASRILKIISETSVDSRLLTKNLTY